MTEADALSKVNARPAAAFEFSLLRTQDIPDCVEIVRRTFAEFDGEPDAIANWFDARITHNPWQRALDGIGLGARDGGRLIAFRAMSAQPWWIEGKSTVIAFMGNMSVDSAYRGCGLGGKLIANSRECAELTGTTTAGNITQKVYRKQGFFVATKDGRCCTVPARMMSCCLAAPCCCALGMEKCWRTEHKLPNRVTSNRALT